MTPADEPIVALAADGNPILDQFSEEGFVDCTFRVASLSFAADAHRLRLTASHRGESVGFEVVMARGMRGSIEKDGGLISDRIYRSGIRFLRSGPESDRLLTALAALYGLAHEPGTRMVDSFPLTVIALQERATDLEMGPVKLKLFGNDAPDADAENYFECFFNLSSDRRFAFWNEKDVDYRAPLFRSLLTRPQPS